MNRRPLVIMFVIAAFAVGPPSMAADDDPLDITRASGGARRTLYKALLQREQGETDEARQTLRRHLEAHPDQDHALVRFHLGQVLALLDSTAAAADELAVAVELEPDLEPAWRNLGEIRYQLARYGAAADAFEQAWRLDPEHDARLRYYQGVALLQGDRAAESLDVLVDLLDAGDAQTPLEWYRALLSAAITAGRPTDALGPLEDLVVRAPDDPEAWFMAYQQASAAADYPRAIRNLTVTGYLRPLTRDEKMILGDLCLAADLPARAVRHFEAAMEEAGGESEEDLDRLISAYLAADSTDDALQALDRRLATAPSARFWRLKGELLYGRQEYAAGIAAFEAAAALDPADRSLDLYLGYCHLETGDVRAAESHFSKAREDEILAPRAREALAYLASLETSDTP